MFKLTLNSLWSHKRRLVSTCIAVILGVAFMAGTLVLTSTINSVFDDLFAKTNQNTDAIVRGPIVLKSQQQGTVRAKIPESTVEKVRRQPHVVAAEPQIATVAITLLDKSGDPMGGNGPPTFVGSWPEDRKLNDYRVVQGRPPTKDGEVVINKAAAKAGKFVLGGKLSLVTSKGTQRFDIVGLTRFGDADSAGGLIYVGTTLPQAQTLIGEPDKIDVVLAHGDGIAPEALVAQLKAAKLTPKADVLTGAQAATETANEIKDAFGFFSTILLVFAFIALFVGAFIISNTFGILVAQRTRELALLRAIGASKGQVLGSVLLEAVVIGVVSAVLGFLAGVGLAAGAIAALRAVGIDLPSAGVTISPMAAGAAMVVGVVLTMGAAILPAIRATRVPPIAALRDVAIDTSGQSKLRAGAGVLFLLAGLVSIVPAFGDDPTTKDLPGIGTGMGLIVLAVLVLGPVMARPLSRIVGAPLPAIKGITGLLSRQNAMRSPRRTASTASALIIGVTLVGFITVFAASAQTSISRTIGRGFEGDYIVQPANAQGGAAPGASPQLAKDLAKVPGVDLVTAASFTGAKFELPGKQEPTGAVGGIDPKTYGEIFKVTMAQGSISDLERGTIIVDRQVANDNGLKIGSRVKVTSLAGRTGSYRVSAIGDEPVLLGSWTLSKADADALNPTPADFLVGIKLDKGTSVDAIRPALKKVVREYPTMKLQDREQFTGSIVAQIKALLNVIYGLLAVSIIIALIGIANTLSLSINERTRELGLMRAMGMSRAQLRSSVRWEAVIVALMGTTIGLILGLGLSWVLVKALVSQGITTFDVPVRGMVTVVVFGATLGVVASLRPAAKAAKLNVLEAIATE